MFFSMLFTGQREKALHNEVLNLILSEGTESVFNPLRIIQNVTIGPSMLTGSEGVSCAAISISRRCLRIWRQAVCQLLDEK